MGLFDKLFGGMEDSTSLSAQEAFAGILFGASACDGHIADDEVQGLITALLRMKLYKRFNDKQFNTMLNKLHGIVKRNGVDVLVEACVKTLPEELYKPAFANACDIVLADGVVEKDEKEFIDKLRAFMKIGDDEAKSIAQVMIVKNKG